MSELIQDGYNDSVIISFFFSLSFSFSVHFCPCQPDAINSPVFTFRWFYFLNSTLFFQSSPLIHPHAFPPAPSFTSAALIKEAVEMTFAVEWVSCPLLSIRSAGVCVWDTGCVFVISVPKHLPSRKCSTLLFYVLCLYLLACAHRALGAGQRCWLPIDHGAILRPSLICGDWLW